MSFWTTRCLSTNISNMCANQQTITYVNCDTLGSTCRLTMQPPSQPPWFPVDWTTAMLFYMAYPLRASPSCSAFRTHWHARCPVRADEITSRQRSLICIGCPSPRESSSRSHCRRSRHSRRNSLPICMNCYTFIHLVDKRAPVITIS